MDGNWQPYSIRFIFQILLRAVAKQKYGYPILWIFLGFTIEDIASSRQAPTFHEHNLAVIAENWKVFGTYSQKIALDRGTEDAFIAAAVQLCHSRPHPNRFPLVLAPIASFLEVIGLIIWV